MPDIGRPPGSPAVSTTRYWLCATTSASRGPSAQLFANKRSGCQRSSQPPQGPFDPASRQSSACPRDALVVDRQLWTLPAVVITRRLPRRCLVASSCSQALSSLTGAKPRDRLGGDARPSTAPFCWLMLPVLALLRVYVRLDSGLCSYLLLSVTLHSRY